VGWIELAADLTQMQASVNKVFEFCTNSQFINQLNTVLHRERGNPTSEPKHKFPLFPPEQQGCCVEPLS
jgi:hypothetical protein